MNMMENIQAGQPLHTNKAKSNDTPDSQEEITLDNMIINVFFDGTGNNMFNSELMLKKEEELSKEEAAIKKKYHKETSYENYYSNIALLYMASSGAKDVENIYLQGSGTFKHEGDSYYGLGLSMGESGVYARVAEAFELIQIRTIDERAYRITLNVFGFSRGAFYARYFCAMAKVGARALKRGQSYKTQRAIYQERAERQKCGRQLLALEPDLISINLVGIFDTVSSHGFHHYNDVTPFRLNIGKQQEIAKIVHLTAQNDYRNHFPLTHINTAVEDGIGFECSLPGAHSDLGGAYAQNWQETKQYLSVFGGTERFSIPAPKKSGEIHWSWFKKMGYYQGEPQKKIGQYGDFEVKYSVVRATRRFTSNSYQFIPLLIMKEISEDIAQLKFTEKQGKKPLEENLKSIQSNTTLNKFKDYAHNYIIKQKNYQKCGLDFAVHAKNALSAPEQLELYHLFIHNSLDPNSIANGSNRRNAGPKRIEIHDNS